MHGAQLPTGSAHSVYTECGLNVGLHKRSATESVSMYAGGSSRLTRCLWSRSAWAHHYYWPAYT